MIGIKKMEIQFLCITCHRWVTLGKHFQEGPYKLHTTEAVKQDQVNCFGKVCMDYTILACEICL